MRPTDELGEMARRVIDTNRYLTLGTTEPDHRPRLSPVYFTHVDGARPGTSAPCASLACVA